MKDSSVDFSGLILTLDDEGNELVLARPGLSLMLYYSVPIGRLGPAIAATLQDFLAFIAPHAFDMYYAPGAVYKKMSAKVLDTTLKGLLATEEGDEFFEFHFGPGLEIGSGYAAHFKGSNLEDSEYTPNETNLLMLEFPPTIFDLKSPAEIFDFVVRTADRIEFNSGLCGYAFQHPVMVLDSEAHEAIAKVAMRYRGFDISYDDIRDDLKDRVCNVSWINLLGKPLVNRLGGLNKLRGQLAAGTSLVEVEHGALVITSERPPLGDVNRRAPDLQPLKDFAKVTKPLRVKVDYLGSDDESFAGRWLSRLDD
jgi:hypothetical protein